MNLQALTFSNGMFGSVYIGTMRVSDSGLMNMNSIDAYLSQLFCKFSMRICCTSNQPPTFYGDIIFS